MRTLGAALIELTAPVAFLACLVMVQPVSADTVKFVDTTNTIDVDHVGTRDTITVVDGCGSGPTNNERFQCQISIQSSTTPASTTMSLNIAEPGVDPTSAVSDYVTAIPGTNSYLVIFASDPPGDPAGVLGLTPLPGARSILETGGVQTAFTLHWTDGSSDTIKFQSDLEPVPEPSSLLLLASGLAGLAVLSASRGSMLNACEGPRFWLSDE